MGRGRKEVGVGARDLSRLQDQEGGRPSRGRSWASLLRAQSGAGPGQPPKLLEREEL